MNANARKNYSEMYGFASILQGIRTLFVSHCISMHLFAFCKMYLEGFHWISVDLRPVCKGYPLGLHWISMDLRPFCKGCPLGFQCIIIMDLHRFCNRVPLEMSLDFNGFASFLQRGSP
jgi:hypothetical protein